MNIKKTIEWSVLIAVFMSLTGCYQAYHVRSDSRINDFPTPSHNYKVEIFFPGETPADNEYIRTHIFQVTAPAGSQYAWMVQQMREKADAAHVDAVIIINKDNYTQWVSSKSALDYVAEILTGVYVPETHTLTEETVLVGLGIKYKANVDYLTKYRLVDQLHLYDTEKQDYMHIADLYPDFNNVIFKVENTGDSDKGVFHYEQLIKKHSLAFLIDDKSSSWRYSLSASSGKLKKRKYTNPTTQTHITVSYNYGADGKLNSLKTKHRYPGRIPEEYLLKLEIDSLGRFTEQIVKKRDGTPLLIKWFYYNGEGYLVNSLVYSIEDGKEIPFLKIDYFYYQEEDVYTYF